LANFVGAPATEIATVQNASAAARAVFGSVKLSAGDEIIVSDHVYGAVEMGAERLARRWQARVISAHVPRDSSKAEAADCILRAVTSRTRMIVVDHISSATARFFPAEEIVAAVAGRNIVVLIDGAHALGT